MARKLLTEISILMVQPRSDLPMVEHEIKCIAQYGGLSKNQLRSVSPFYSEISESLLENVDGVIIGGSDTSVLDDFPWTNSIIELIHKIAEVKMPLFGSCWGHQMVAKAFGGEVVSDISRKEMGSIEVVLTPQGKNDPLFGKLPEKFVAQSGHKDHVIELPQNIDPLAYSDLSPYQAIKVKDCPIYGAQFHADMDKIELKERLEYYQYDYVNTEEFDNICNSLQNSPEAVKILAAFINDVVL
ncbi:MAG: type 1 glutamine amidotransferase [Acidobacteria bacterium]|nr:type 1 glutamine amidotransferase [Acidobacteriota bacterium]